MATVSAAFAGSSAGDGYHSGPEVSVRHYIFEAETLAEAMLALRLQTAAVFDLYANGAVLLPRQSISASRLNDDTFEGSVVYGVTPAQPVAPPGAPPEVAVTVGGGTTKLLSSLRTVNVFAAPGETVPDYGGLINVTRDSVDGVDVPGGGFNFVETHYLPADDVTTAYLRQVDSLRGCVNDNWFRGWEAGEILFVSATFNFRGSGDVQATFSFNREANLHVSDDPVVVGDIEITEKEGQDYLWFPVREDVAVDGDDNPIAAAPKRIGAIVSQVFKRADFSLLNIGTEPLR